MQLLQAHLVACNLPGVRHERTTYPPALESWEGLHAGDPAPMRDEGIRVTFHVHPACQDITHDSDQEPAVGAQAGDELISHRRDNTGIDGQKGKANRPAGIADADPAGNQFLSQSRTDLPRITALVQDRKNTLTPTRSTLTTPEV